MPTLKTATLRWNLDGQEHSQALSAEETILGRNSDCQLLLNHASVSREHAAILVQDGQYLLKDLASSYGTRLGGRRLTPFEPHVLEEGAELQIGKVVLHFTLHGAVPNTITAIPADFQHFELRHEMARFQTTLISQLKAAGPMPKGAELERQIETEIARLDRFLVARFREYEVLQEVTQTIAGILDLRELLSTVLKLASRVLNADRGLILLYDPIANDLRSMVTRHFERADGSALEHDLAFSQTIARSCFNSKEVVIIEDAMQDARFASAHSIVASSIRSVVCLPLVKADRVSGVLYLDNLKTPGSFNDQHLKFLRTFAAQTALALDNARLYTQAVTDGLTQLYNRKFADERILEEMLRSNRYERSCSLILIDVDFFKKVNDSYGHHAGDCVLQRLAAMLLEKARASDVTARYGGEEFLMLLPETDATGAFSFAERLRKRVEELEIRVDQQTIRVTISCGVATYRSEFQTSVKAFVNEADQGLYLAKNEGRNQVRKL